jgi:multidrug efflux system outer membrane protein
MARHPFNACILAPLLCVLLAGCATQPAVEHPEVPVPDSWTRTVGQPAPAGQQADWWNRFGSPELSRLVTAAREANPDLAAAAHRIAQAAALVRVAGAGLYPAVEAAGSGSRNWRGEGGSRTADSVRAVFEASYEVDLWGRNRLGVEAALAERIASEYDREAVALSLSAEVATAYFQYLSLGDRIGRTGRILATAERVLALVEQQEALGVASALELAQQRAAVASLRATLPQLERQRAETRNALAALLGRAPGDLRIEAASLDSVEVPPVAAGLPSTLLERRPDLRSREAALAAARADVDAARAALLPSIRLTGSAGFASDALSGLFSPAGMLASLAAGLTAPIFDAGRLAGARDVALAREAELVEAYRGAVIDAFRDVEDALAAIEYLAATEEAQRAAAGEARRAYELAEARYRAGVVSFLTVLETQRTLFQQEDTLEQTRLARLDAAVGLYRALGGGW